MFGYWRMDYRFHINWRQIPPFGLFILWIETLGLLMCLWNRCYWFKLFSLCAKLILLIWFIISACLGLVIFINNHITLISIQLVCQHMLLLLRSHWRLLVILFLFLLALWHITLILSCSWLYLGMLLMGCLVDMTEFVDLVQFVNIGASLMFRS